VQTTTFVGLDASKNSIMATAVDSLGHRLDQRKLTTRDGELVQFLQELPGQKRVVLEACNVWEHIYDAASSTGAKVLLAHPLKTRLITEATLKTDKVDSEALAKLARLDAVAEAYAPSSEQRALRHLMRDRVFYWKEWKAIANHTYAALLLKGIPYEDGVLRAKKAREELRRYDVPEVNRGLEALAQIEEVIKPLDQEVRLAFDRSKEAQLLATTPGVGRVTSMTLVAFLCPIERFHSLEAVVKYCGLCPSVHQSGEKSYHGHLVWDAHSILKWVLVEAQWATRRVERRGDIARVAKRVARRGHVNDGSVAAARSLVRICAAVLKRGTPYQPHAPGSLATAERLRES
jgi:transposase